MVRQGHLIAVVTFLTGCAFLLLGVGCAGTSSETSNKEQEPTEATKKEQTRSPEVTASEETTALEEETTGFQAPEGTQTSSTARMVCLRAAQGASSPPPQSTEALNETPNDHVLTRVLTPKVAAHPDGVHIQIDNRLGKHIFYETEPDYAKSGLRGLHGNKGLPEGKSITVTFIPPGTAKIACEPPSRYVVNNYAYFEVVKGDSGYKSLDLECKPGVEPRFSSMMASGAASKFELVSYRDPVERARKVFKEGLKEGDVVEEAGYPEDPDPTVRVVRNGKVIATAYISSLESFTTYCDGQI